MVAVAVLVESFDKNAAVAKIVDICCPVVLADVFEPLDELAALVCHGQGLDHVVGCFVVDLVQHGCVPLSVNCG